MSSPVHHPDDLDAALRYAPPWARRTNTRGAASPGELADESQLTSWEGDYEPSFDGDRAMLDLRHQLSLNPDQAPEPPVRIDERPTLDRIALRLCAVAGIAALVAWLTISLPINISLPLKIALPEILKPHIEEVAHAAVVPTVTPTPTATPVKLVHIHAAVAPLPMVSAPPAAPAPPAVVPARVAEAAPQAAQQPPKAEPAVDPSPPQPAASPVTLSPDEIAVLVKRGNDFLTNGDISSARLLLRRAAEAGNAEAALALGSTFDPAVIARLGAIGVQADAAKARQWYEKAAALGSDRASEQIAKLAANGR